MRYSGVRTTDNRCSMRAVDDTVFPCVFVPINTVFLCVFLVCSYTHWQPLYSRCAAVRLSNCLCVFLCVFPHVFLIVLLYILQLSDFVTAGSGGGGGGGGGGVGGGFITGLRVWTIAGDPAGRGFMDKFGAEARFNSPRGVFVDSSGSILVIDAWNHRQKKKQSLA